MIWIERSGLAESDRWFGPDQGRTGVASRNVGRDDLWPNMIALYCLQSYYDHSGDRRVLDLMTGYFRWELAVPEGKFLPPYWQQQRAADNLHSVHWLYNRTGQPWLLELAEKIHRHTANWTDSVPNWHNVNIAQAFGGPARFYPQSKDPKHLIAAERNYQEVRSLYGQTPGGMFGGDENCRPGYTGPRQAIETCGIVEQMLSDETLLAITGRMIWADRCELVALNTLPAAFTADLKAAALPDRRTWSSATRPASRPACRTVGRCSSSTPTGIAAASITRATAGPTTRNTSGWPRARTAWRP